MHFIPPLELIMVAGNPQPAAAYRVSASSCWVCWSSSLSCSISETVYRKEESEFNTTPPILINPGSCMVRLRQKKNNSVIAEIFIRVKISYSSVCQLSYARNFRTATLVSDTHAYVYGFRMLLNFVLSAKSTKYTKLNRVRKFVRLQ